jgi:hypothetical protein
MHLKWWIIKNWGPPTCVNKYMYVTSDHEMPISPDVFNAGTLENINIIRNATFYY